MQASLATHRTNRNLLNRFGLRPALGLRGASFAILIAAALLSPFATAEAAGQKPAVVTLVPAANWHELSSEKTGVESVAKWGGEPAVDTEFGVKAVEHRVYELNNKPGDSAQCDVLIEDAADPSAAYGLLTYYHTESMTRNKGTELVETGPEGGVAARGPVFVRLVAPPGGHVSAGDFHALAVMITGIRPTDRVSAGLPESLLPSAGLVMGSERYMLGNETARRVLPGFPVETIGFAQGAEVQAGAYSTFAAGAKARPERATLVAISYPTFQIARERYDQMEKALGLNQDRGSESVYGKRTGPFVFLTLHQESKAAATRLLDELKVEQQVSWDQRYPGKKSVVLQMFEIIVANLLLVCILVGLAVAGGLLIVLSKRIARKWFPSAEWGSVDGERLITLNLR